MRAVTLTLLAAVAAVAQNSPKAAYIYPAGAQAGSTVEVRVAGQYLTGPKQAYVSGEGVTATVVRYGRPVSGADAQKLRDEAKEINDKGRAKQTPDDAMRLLEIRDKLEEWGRANIVPALAEYVVVQLAVAPTAKPGPYRLRIDTNAGLTNPILFQVGDLPEYTRKLNRVAPAYNVVNGGVPQIRFTPTPAPPAIDVSLPVTCNAQMMPGLTDGYRFEAKKGDRLRISVAARELMPYLSDAVPGWFQAAVTLRDSGGRPIAAADHNEFRPDPLLRVTIPADGEYTAEIHDSIFRGREDFVYRLTIAPEPPAPIASRRAAKAPKRPGKLKLPATVEGAIAKPGEVHRFRIDGKAGDEVVAEVLARRAGSPLDSGLRLLDSKGRELAANDDFEDPGAGLLTHQSDSYLTCRLPGKGTYYLELTDAQQHAGPGYTYRLRVSRPQPDFELRVNPSSLNMRTAQTLPVTVTAIRRDGFDGDIALTLKNAPPKLAMSGAVIPSGQSKVRITLTAPPAPGSAPYTLELIGKAQISGREVSHPAVPADDMEQAFAYHHLVPQDVWMLRVLGNATSQATWPVSDKRVRLEAGKLTAVTLPIPARMQKDLQLALSDAPEGIAIERLSPRAMGLDVMFKVEPDKAKPGLKGNLIVEAWRETGQPQPNRQRNRQRIATLPAVPFEVVP